MTELLTEEKLEEIYYNLRAGAKTALTYEEFLVAIRAFEKGLGVAKVIEHPDSCYSDDPALRCKWAAGFAEHPMPECNLNGDDLCFQGGPVLIRARKEEK